MAASPEVTALHQIEPIERETIKRVTWRLMPLLMLGYFCAYLDRSNVGMAATTMVKDLGFTNAVFGFGAGLFFLGYFIAEIPSNLILNKVGARRWIARILFTWGIIAALTGFVWNELELLRQSRPARTGRGRVLSGRAAVHDLVVPVVLSHPDDGHLPVGQRDLAVRRAADRRAVADLQGQLGLQGWQWLFIIEGLPPIIMCFVTWRLLTDRPKDAAWLTPEQRTWLQGRLDSEQTQRESSASTRSARRSATRSCGC
jgi:ACS family tartrate transporter-like MFS transporter